MGTGLIFPRAGTESEPSVIFLGTGIGVRAGTGIFRGAGAITNFPDSALLVMKASWCNFQELWFISLRLNRIKLGQKMQLMKKYEDEP